MPRYVILRHETPVAGPKPSHWDFMLEIGEVLRTWAIERSPDSAESQPAQLLADHRAAYLTYEGPISDGRGAVTRWDEGIYETTSDVASDHVELKLIGRRLNGRVVLDRRATNLSDSIFEYRYAAATELRP